MIPRINRRGSGAADVHDNLRSSISQPPSHTSIPVELVVQPMFEPPDNPALSTTFGPYRDPRVFDDGWYGKVYVVLMLIGVRYVSRSC